MEVVIIIFFLLFAILAFGWFYLQRAKARDAGATDRETVASTAAPAPAPAVAAPAPAPAEPTDVEATRTDQPAS